MRNKIKDIYIEAHILTESLTSSTLVLSDDANHFLQDYNLILYVLTNDLSIYKINTSFCISLIELNSALYNLAINETLITQNCTDVYIIFH